jgi:hypothetical protein
MMAKQTASGQDGAPQGAEKASEPTAARPAGSGDEGGELRQRVDQVGTLVGKGLDLAEAGLSLGVTIVNRIGTAAQQQMINRVVASVQDGAPPPGQSHAVPDPAPAPREAETSFPEPGAFYVTNRLPLVPGGSVKVSFSINNDSMIAPKKVALRIDGFVGQMTGATLSAKGFGVKPAARRIAPMDFDKFVLGGTVPTEIPPDVYIGLIVVESDEQLEIPIRLVVSQ